jgi:hypothetical protein
VKREKSPISAHSPTAERVSMPRRQRKAGDGLGPRRVGDELLDVALQRVPAHDQGVDRAEVVQQRQLRRPAEIDAPEPVAVAGRPRPRGSVEAHVVARSASRRSLLTRSSAGRSILPGGGGCAEQVPHRPRASGRAPLLGRQHHLPAYVGGMAVSRSSPSRISTAAGSWAGAWPATCAPNWSPTRCRWLWRTAGRRRD